jgi:hypothetical protein
MIEYNRHISIYAQKFNKGFSYCRTCRIWYEDGRLYCDECRKKTSHTPKQKNKSQTSIMKTWVNAI